MGRISAVIVLIVLGLHAVTEAEVVDTPFETPPEIVVKDGYTLNRQVLTENEIPVLLLRKDEFSDVRTPIVFLLHGGGKPDVMQEEGLVAKEQWFAERFFDTPYMLADGGLTVVLMDQSWAGERFDPDSRKVVLKNYFEALIDGFVQTAVDVSAVIDALSDRDDLDTTRVGTCGRSGGGIVSLILAVSDPRIAALTSWVGSANLVEMGYEKMPPRVLDRLIDRSETVVETLQTYDAIHNLEKIPPKAVMMLNNTNDPHVPFRVAKTLYDALIPLYEDHPKKLRFVERTPGEATHQLTEADYREGCEWLVKWLNE